MALVVEDGTGLAGANSYVSVAEARTYALGRGLSLPVADADVEEHLITAKDFLEKFRAEFKGYKLTKAQALQWPRGGVVVDNFEIDTDEIPQLLKDAQSRLACEIEGGTDLFSESDGREVIEETIAGVITTKWATTGNTAPQPSLTAVQALLDPLLRGEGAGGSLINIRG